MPVDIYIFDEPTRGIDVGAKSEIYSLIERISGEGASVIIISSEIPEVQSICDRIAIMKEGEVVKILQQMCIRDRSIREDTYNHSSHKSSCNIKLSIFKSRTAYIYRC